MDHDRSDAARDTGRVLRCGDLHIDLGACGVTREGRPLSLTPTEMRLLALLAAQCGRAVPQAEIARALGGAERPLRLQAVVGHVHTLRQKLGRDAIETIRGHGLRLKP